MENFFVDLVSGGNSIELPMLPNPTRCQRLHITAPLGLNQHYINRLCDLIPGLEYCDFNEQTGRWITGFDKQNF